ncbi:hypothetical protein K420107F6_17800 [Lactonifactor longoviformis]
MVLHWRRCGRAGGCQIKKKKNRKVIINRKGKKLNACTGTEDRANLHQQGNAVSITGFTSDLSEKERFFV